AIRAGTRVVQNIRKTGKDAASQIWANDDGVITLQSNPKFVIAIDGDANRDGTRITLQEKKTYNEKQKWYFLGGQESRPASPSPSRAESISTRPDNFPTGWFYIKSAVTGLVIDIEHGLFTDPMKAGARAEMNHQKIDNGDGRHSLLELQLWRYERGFLINRRTGLVLDIQGGSLKLNARVCQWQRKAGKEAENQHWFYENGYIANVYNSRLVLDIDGDGSRDGAKIAIGERKVANHHDQQWLLEEVRFQWLATPVPSSQASIEEVKDRSGPVVAPVPPQIHVKPPTNGWFWIKSKNSGLVIDVESSASSDPLQPGVLLFVNDAVTTVSGDDTSKIETQLWRYENGRFINRYSGLVIDIKQGVVRYGARLTQDVVKSGKPSQHQLWESVRGNIFVQGKDGFAVDIEGDGSKAGSRLTLQRPKTHDNADQQWVFQQATYDWLLIERVVTHTYTERTIVSESSKVVQLTKNDWFFIKSSATGLVMDLEAGWITAPTDPGAYITMKKQRSIDDTERSFLERQLWRYDDGYLINRRTGYVLDIYGRSAVVGVKLVQQHKSERNAEGVQNQLWNIADGRIQLVNKPKLFVNVENNKESSRLYLVEQKGDLASHSTWTFELAQASWLTHSRVNSRSMSIDEGIEKAQIIVRHEIPVNRWFYIKSKASGLVLDVEHGFFKDHLKAGAALELNHQKLHASSRKHALLDLQLWRYEDGYLINRRTGLVIDVARFELSAGSRLIQWERKPKGDNANQQFGFDNGFIHVKSKRNLVLDVDGNGTRDGAQIALNERKDKKNLDQRWTFEEVHFSWLTMEVTHIEGQDTELLEEYETSHLVRYVEHKTAPVDCWFYLHSGINDLVLEVEHGRNVHHKKAGTAIRLAHQRTKSGKHSHALLELQLWRFQDGYFINRRSGLVLAVTEVAGNARLVQQVKKINSAQQKWVVENGRICLSAMTEFTIFVSYAQHGSYAFIRKVRRGEHAISWGFNQVQFTWLTLDREEAIEEEEASDEEEIEQLESTTETEVTYLKREAAVLYELKTFSSASYFFIRAANGYVLDIEHGFGKNHMKVGACARLHPQTTSASSSQHAMLDIQLWTYRDGYLINKRTGLALTIEGGSCQSGARLIQDLPKNATKWTFEGGHICPQGQSSFVLNFKEGQVILVERTVAVTWTVYEVRFSWLVYTEVELIEVEKAEDFDFYLEFEEVVIRSAAKESEVIEFAKTREHLVAPLDTWFYLSVGNGKVASVDCSSLIERKVEGAAIQLVQQKNFSSAVHRALVELQLWKLEGAYLVNRFTGMYLTVEGEGAGAKLVLSSKRANTAGQQWAFSEDGNLSLVSNTNFVVDFKEGYAVIVERSACQTSWVYNAVTFGWLSTLDAKTEIEYQLLEDEVREFETVYTRYERYLTTITITRTTTITTTTRRIIRIHKNIQLENAIVYEHEGRAWATHLVEAGTNIEYVMQLVYNQETQLYYIYVQWGELEGQLEGPYDTVEQATKEYKELFVSKINVEWSESVLVIEDELEEEKTEVKSKAIGNWSTAPIEYDTVTVEVTHETSSTPVPVVAKETRETTTKHRTTYRSGKTEVDALVPHASQYAVHYDSDIYSVELTNKQTGVVYTSQLLYNVETKVYYVYLRYSETEYKLEGPYNTVEEAKESFHVVYRTTYGLEWEDRNTTASTNWSITLKSYDTVSVYEDMSDEEEEHVTTEVTGISTSVINVEAPKRQETDVQFITESETVVEDGRAKEILKETVTRVETGTVKPSTSSSWFKKIAVGTGLLTAGAAIAAVGALNKADGVWKRTIQVLTKRKAHVDEKAPIAKTSYVFYDEEDVYDATLVEKHTGVTYKTQLLFDKETRVYYIYIRYGDEVTVSEGYKTIEAAKEAFQVTYQEKTGVVWNQRTTQVSEQWTYETVEYEVFEEIEEVVEEVDEEVATVIIAKEKEIIVGENVQTETIVQTEEKDVLKEEVITTVTTEETTETKKQEEVTIKHDEGKATIQIETRIEDEVKAVEVKDAASQETDVTKEITTTIQTGVTTKPVVEKETSWYRRLASGAGDAASGALEQVGGVWKRAVDVEITRKGHVDEKAPLTQKTTYVYYDDEEVYDAVLVQKDTGVTYKTQLLFDSDTKVYYIYLRHGDEVTLSEGYKTIEQAKDAFQLTYQEKFGVVWTERTTTVSEQWTYEIQEYETYVVTETIEEIYEEEEAQVLIEEQKRTITTGDTQTVTHTEVTVQGGEIAKETAKTTVQVGEDVTKEQTTTIVQKEEVAEVTTEVTEVVNESSDESDAEESIKKTTTTTVTVGHIEQPAKTSWLKKLTGKVSSGVSGTTKAIAGGAIAAIGGAVIASSGALEKVDGVWKRTVKVLLTQKAHADERAPMAKTSYVYYDDEDVFDAELVRKDTGVTYKTQLLFDTKTQAYYIYVLYGEEVTVEGPFETVEKAKESFQIIYQKQTGVAWTERTTTVSEHWTYEVKTYETFEVEEEIEEILEEEEAKIVLEEQVKIGDRSETKTSTVIIHDDAVQEERFKTEVEGADVTKTEEQVIVHEETKSTVEVTKEVKEEVESSSDESDSEETVIKTTVTSVTTGTIEKPAAPQKTSWFRRLASGAADAATSVAHGAGSVVKGTAGAVAGAATGVVATAVVVSTGALDQVDGVWKRTVKVLTTQKAHVDERAPMAKTSYVYYDDEDVFDAELVQKETGVTYKTQLLFDTKTNAYYIYILYGEEVTTEGPFETIEQAKDAFQVIYQKKTGHSWTERTTVTEHWTYEVKTYETFEVEEEIEEIVEEDEATLIITEEKERAITGETTSMTTVITKTEEENVSDVEIQVEKTEHTTIEKEGEVVKVEEQRTQSTVVYETEVVQQPAQTETIKTVTKVEHIGVVHQPTVVEQRQGWFRRLASGTGAAVGAVLTQADGAWKRAVDVVTVKKAEVDERAPVSKTTYVYYDDEEVFDAQLTEKSTGVTYKTQLLYDAKVNKYFIYILYGEEVKLEGPYETVEQAKDSFAIIYREKTGHAWTDRKTITNEQWSYEVKTYETIEVTETVEEEIEEEEAKVILEQEKTISTGDRTVIENVQVITQDETVVTETKETEVKVEDVVVSKEEVVLTHTDETIEVVETKKAEFVADDESSSDESDTEETVTKTTVTTVTTGTIEKPAAPQKTSWFRRLASGAADAAGAVAKGATGAVQGAAHATGSVVKGTAGAVAGVAT
ncbi:hypothetical protein DFQ26_009301, partial [Actinomortierella ambigua]